MASVYLCFCACGLCLSVLAFFNPTVLLLLYTPSQLWELNQLCWRNSLHSRYKECHCGAGTMRHGWIYIEPLWYAQFSDRRMQTVQRAEKKPLSYRSDWTPTKVLHIGVWNSSCVLQSDSVCVCECDMVHTVHPSSWCTISMYRILLNVYVNCINAVSKCPLLIKFLIIGYVFFSRLSSCILSIFINSVC